MAGANPLAAAFATPAPAQPPAVRPPPPANGNPLSAAFGAHPAPPHPTPPPTTSAPPGVLGKPSAAAATSPDAFANLGAGHSGADTGMAMTAVNKALDAQGWAVRRGLTGETNTDAQMAKIRHAIPGMDAIYNLPGGVPIHTGIKPIDNYAAGVEQFSQHLANGMIDAALQGALDPLTVETMGVGPLLKGLGVGAKVEPLIARGINSNAPSRIVHDALQWGGPAKRAGFDVPAIRGAANKAGNEGLILQQHIVERARQIVEGAPLKINGKMTPGVKLEPTERVRVAQMLNGETVPAPTAREETAYRQLRTLTNLDHRLRQNAAIEQMIRGNVPPAERDTMREAFRAGKPPTDPKALEQYNEIAEKLKEDVPSRAHYMPSVHQATPEEAKAGREGFTGNLADTFDPRTLQRDEFRVGSHEDLMRGFEAMASNAGKQRATAGINSLIDNLGNDPKVRAMFDQAVPATGNARNDWEKFKDGWMAVVGYPRAATVSLLPRHGANIYDLAINTVPPEKIPEFTAKVADLTKKLMTASAREHRALTASGRNLGAISGSFTERKPFFQHFPDWVPKVGGKSVPGLSKWSAFNNKLVWAIDEASKQVYGEILEATGEAKGLRAGGLASQRLVDYEHLSPVQKALRYVAPFGTFRGAIPGAVLGGIARNPARAAFLSRASHGTMYGARPEKGQEGYEMSNPTADVGEMLNGPEGAARFAASTLGNIPQAIVGTGANLIGQMQSRDKPDMMKNPLSYGQTWFPSKDKNGQFDLGYIASQALAGVPEAGVFLEGMGVSRYKWKGLAHEAMRQATGIQHVVPQGAGGGAPLDPNAFK